jgi:ribosomal protein L12E/L44/L45/RPP1/RPP2
LAARYDLISKHLSAVPAVGRRRNKQGEKPREEENSKEEKEMKEHEKEDLRASEGCSSQNF